MPSFHSSAIGHCGPNQFNHQRPYMSLSRTLAQRRPTCCSLWLLSRCTARHDLTHQLILLHITAKLEVVDALLEADQDIIELHIEVVALLQKLGKLLLVYLGDTVYL